MKIAVIGSRNFTDKSLLENELCAIKEQIEMIVSGGAKGADTFAENWALENSIPVDILKPDWKNYGRSAGIVRNKKIIDLCDYCYVFWDHKSKGTLFGINYCKKIGKPIKILHFIPTKTNLK